MHRGMRGVVLAAAAGSALAGAAVPSAARAVAAIAAATSTTPLIPRCIQASLAVSH